MLKPLLFERLFYTYNAIVIINRELIVNTDLIVVM